MYMYMPHVIIEVHMYICMYILYDTMYVYV